MATREFLWTDTGAPVVNGVAGSVLAMMKTCLVGAGGGIAYGSGPGTKLVAGWQLEYEDVAGKKAVFRNSLAAGGTGCYLWVDDSHATQTSFRMYSAMGDTSDIATGVDPVPPLGPASTAGGVWIWKAPSADATPRQWAMWADARTIYMGFRHAGTDSSTDSLAWFGDYDSHVPGDGFAFGCSARGYGNNRSDPSNSASGLVCATKRYDALAEVIFSAGFGVGLWLARNAAGAAGAIQGAPPAVPTNDSSIATSSNCMVLGSNRALSNPSLAGHEYWSTYYIISGGGIRGTLRGVYLPLSNLTGLALGTKRVAPAGAPAGSVIAIARGSGVLSTSSPLSGGIGVEAALDW